MKSVLLWLAMAGSAHALAPPTPDWNSDRLRTARSIAPMNGLEVRYTREVTGSGTPPLTETGVVELADDFVEVASDNKHVLDDFVLCRSLAWRDGEPGFTNDSCYAAPAFRLAELINRRTIHAALATPSAKPDEEPYWAEQELAVQDAVSDPLVASHGRSEVEWRLGRQIVVRTSDDGIAILPAERKAIARYLARDLDLHPQVRQALVEAGRLPRRIVIERQQLGHASTETITFSNPERRPVSYPLPPHLVSTLTTQSQTRTIEGAGLRQTILAIAGTARPPRPSFEGLVDRIRTSSAAGKPMAAYLAFLAVSQQYGGQVQTDPAKAAVLRAVIPAVKAAMATPDVSSLNQASELAGSADPSPLREASARYLANATALDELPFGTFRYVTFANLVRSSGDTRDWDKSAAARMPSLPDCYWTHIAAYPWAGPVYMDLGDFWYRQFDMVKAWQAWDLGRAVDPQAPGSPPDQQVTNLEANLRSSIPSNF